MNDLHDNFYISCPRNLPDEMFLRLEKAAKLHRARVNRLLKHELRGWSRDLPKLRGDVASARIKLCALWDEVRAYVTAREEMVDNAD